ncbi:hypothetical protein [Pleomorphovibrio marinus]|uniref:hypothetical protein n=1 Tax=Pleomorphovibrio marinus TaxID=2164132 RepID=UPI000E0CABA6|nr:hypothetical protein [Pleomorphovibrio marinus]
MRTSAIHALHWRGIADGLLNRLFSGESLRLTEVYEEWIFTDATPSQVRIAGTVALNSSTEFLVGGLGIRFGMESDYGLEVPFAIDLPAAPVAVLLAALCIKAGFAKPNDFVDLDVAAAAEWLPNAVDGVSTFSDLDLDLLGDMRMFLFGDDPVRVTLGPLPAFLVLPESWIEQGRHILDANNNITGVESDPEAGPISIKLGEAMLQVSAAGIDVTIEGGGPLTLPPLMIKGTGLALELKGLSIKTGDGNLPSEIASLGADRGFDESWRGVFASEITLWNLDSVFPGGPVGDAAGAGHRITASYFAIDGRGLTGDIAWSRITPENEMLVLNRVSITFDRAWYPSGIEGGGIMAFRELGAVENLKFLARLELDPFASDSDRWRLLLEAEALTPGEPLVSFKSPSSELIAAVSVLAESLGDSDLALLLAAMAAGAGSHVRLIRWKNIEIRSAQASGYRKNSGTFKFEGSISISAELEILLGGEPQPLSVKLGKIEVSYDQAAEPGLRAKSSWSLDDGLILTLPLEVEVGGAVTIDRIGLRKSDENTLLIELGVAMEGTGDISISGLPNVVTIVYDRDTNEISLKLSRDGQPFILLVPGVLYATGTLVESGVEFPLLNGEVGDWSKSLRAALTAYLVGSGKAVAPLDHMKKENYLFALDLGLLTATRSSDGMKAVVLTGDLCFNPGIPIGSTGTALYGLGLTYGQNTVPNAQDGDYTGWFLSPNDDSLAFSTHAKKWVPQGHSWGFGASVAIGSLPDAGRAWNVAAGLFLLLPGPVVMITGKGNLFSPPPELPKGENGGNVEAPFAAAVALDFLRDRLSAELVAEIKIGPNTSPLLELNIPARIEASLSRALDMELAVGRFSPENERVSGRALGLFDITTYVMVTTRGIDNFPNQGRRLEPFAMAYGGAGGLSAGFGSRLAELRLSVQAGFDLGASLSIPPLMVGQIYASGQLVARVICVSVNLGIETKLFVVAPKPFELSGTANFRVGLPWPLPDFKFSGSFSIEKQADWPKAENPIQNISLFPRTNGTAVLANGESFDGVVLEEQGEQKVDGVPVDAGILIAFRAPIGNEHPVIGMVSTQSDDMADKVWEVATTGTNKNGDTERIGWRHVLTKVSLFEIQEGFEEIEIEIHGGWSYRGVDGTTEYSANDAPGGQALRTSLRLLTPLDPIEERRIGTGAEVLGSIFESWQPCEKSPNPKDYEIVFAIPSPDDLGTNQWLVPGKSTVLDRRSLVPGPNGAISYSGPQSRSSSFFAAYTFLSPGVFYRQNSLSFPLTEVLASQHFIITVPAMVFGRLVDLNAGGIDISYEPPCGCLEITVPGGGWSRFAYFVVRRGVEFVLVDHLNEVNVGTVPHQDGTLYVSEDEILELHRVTLGPDATVLRAHTVQTQAINPGLIGRFGAAFLGASYYAEHETREAAIDRRQEASFRLISDLGSRAEDWASGGTEGLLKPDTDYKLEVVVDSYKVKQTDNGDLVIGEPEPIQRHSKIVNFKTEADIKQPLAAYFPGPSWGEDLEQNWNIKTLPDSQAFHYRGNKIKVHVGDAVVVGRISAHKRAVSLRLTHESGNTPEIRAEELLAEKKEGISELQDIISEAMDKWECLDGEAPIYLKLTYYFDTLLKPGGYLAELVAEDFSGERVDKLLYRWRFIASRWSSLETHVRAHQVRRLPRGGLSAEVLINVKSRLGASVPKIMVDDMLLDDLLTITFGEPPSISPDDPLLLLWVRQDGVAGLMLDGPEPFLGPGVTLELAGSRNVVLHTVVRNVLGSRALIIPESVVSPGPLHLRIKKEPNTYEIGLEVPSFSDLTEGARA